MATLAEPIVQGNRWTRNSKTNTLNLFDATIIATSSVAPAYSLAATRGVLRRVVGVASPAAILVIFLPVLFIAIAYDYLNRMDPNCGASYSWVSRTLNPYVGWVRAGSSSLPTSSLRRRPTDAGAYTLQLSTAGDGSAGTPPTTTVWIAVVGVLWLLS